MRLSPKVPPLLALFSKKKVNLIRLHRQSDLWQPNTGQDLSYEPRSRRHAFFIIFITAAVGVISRQVRSERCFLFSFFHVVAFGISSPLTDTFALVSNSPSSQGIGHRLAELAKP